MKNNFQILLLLSLFAFAIGCSNGPVKAIPLKIPVAG